MAWNIREILTYFNQEIAASTTVQTVTAPSQTASEWNSLIVNNASPSNITIEMDNQQQFLVGAFQTFNVDPEANILFRYMNLTNENSDSEIAARTIFVRASSIEIVPTLIKKANGSNTA